MYIRMDDELYRYFLCVNADYCFFFYIPCLNQTLFVFIWPARLVVFTLIISISILSYSLVIRVNEHT